VSDRDIGGEKILGDYYACFANPAGERVLRHLRRILGVDETITPEEALNETLDRQQRWEVPRRTVDTTALHIRIGMARAYQKLNVLVERARELEKGAAR
jgi:hypothetical protein